MDWKHIKADWHLVKNKVKDEWDKLTDADIDEVNGDYDLLQTKIQDRYGIKEEHAKLQLDEWFNNQQWLS
ncbi:CsbD family protein [Brucellaceae bacterium C25G]